MRLTTIGIISVLICSQMALAQIPCENGNAGGHPCQGVDLLAKVQPVELMAENLNGYRLNDVWGWTDPSTNKEYALVGMINGTAFVDISDPANPVVLGHLPEHKEATGHKEDRGSGASWRDVKVYKDHAFVVSEDRGHGMQVFDLTQLRNVDNPPLVFAETAHYDQISNAHNIVINEATGYAYAVGATNGESCNIGGMHVIDIRDPRNPVYAGCYDDASYTHDAQCVVYNGPDTDYVGQEICFNSNRDKIVVADLTDKGNPKTISSVTYNNVYYAHQGWLTEDHKYFVSNDELDEINTGGATKTLLWNMEDLDNPKLLGVYSNPLGSADHNLYTHNGYIYQSNYTSGLRILDARDIENKFVSEVAYFDTYTINDEANFNGSWSNYPYFQSGTVIVTDRQYGLFILKPVFEGEKVTSVDENTLNANPYSIYPNPATDRITIDYINLTGETVHISFFDNQGKELLQSRLTGGTNLLDVRYLERGLYHVRLTRGGKTTIERILLK